MKPKKSRYFLRSLVKEIDKKLTFEEARHLFQDEDVPTPSQSQTADCQQVPLPVQKTEKSRPKANLKNKECFLSQTLAHGKLSDLPLRYVTRSKSYVYKLNIDTMGQTLERSLYQQRKPEIEKSKSGKTHHLSESQKRSLKPGEIQKHEDRQDASPTHDHSRSSPSESSSASGKDQHPEAKEPIKQKCKDSTLHESHSEQGASLSPADSGGSLHASRTLDVTNSKPESNISPSKSFASSMQSSPNAVHSSHTSEYERAAAKEAEESVFQVPLPLGKIQRKVKSRGMLSVRPGTSMPTLQQRVISRPINGDCVLPRPPNARVDTPRPQTCLPAVCKNLTLTPFRSCTHTPKTTPQQLTIGMEDERMFPTPCNINSREDRIRLPGLQTPALSMVSAISGRTPLPVLSSLTPLLRNPDMLKTPAGRPLSLRTPLLEICCNSPDPSIFQPENLSTPALFPTDLDVGVPDILQLIDDDGGSVSALTFEKRISMFDQQNLTDDSVVDYLLDVEEVIDSIKETSTDAESLFESTTEVFQKGRHFKKMPSEMEALLKDKERELRQKGKKVKRKPPGELDEKSLKRKVQRCGNRRSRSMVKACEDLGLVTAQSDLDTVFKMSP